MEVQSLIQSLFAKKFPDLFMTLRLIYSSSFAKKENLSTDFLLKKLFSE